MRCDDRIVPRGLPCPLDRVPVLAERVARVEEEHVLKILGRRRGRALTHRAARLASHVAVDVLRAPRRVNGRVRIGSLAARLLSVHGRIRVPHCRPRRRLAKQARKRQCLPHIRLAVGNDHVYRAEHLVRVACGVRLLGAHVQPAVGAHILRRRQLSLCSWAKLLTNFGEVDDRQPWQHHCELRHARAQFQ